MSTSKARTPRTSAKTANVEAPKSADVSANVVADKPTAVTAPLFKLNPVRTPYSGNTPQLLGQKSGLGSQWVQAAKHVTNSRVAAIAALQALGDTFTMAQALDALAALPKETLGSGTPRSYFMAFCKQGKQPYILPA